MNGKNFEVIFRTTDKKSLKKMLSLAIEYGATVEEISSYAKFDDNSYCKWEIPSSAIKHDELFKVFNVTDDYMLELAKQDRPIKREELGISPTNRNDGLYSYPYP